MFINQSKVNHGYSLVWNFWTVCLGKSAENISTDTYYAEWKHRLENVEYGLAQMGDFNYEKFDQLVRTLRGMPCYEWVLIEADNTSFNASVVQPTKLSTLEDEPTKSEVQKLIDNIFVDHENCVSVSFTVTAKPDTTGSYYELTVYNNDNDDLWDLKLYPLF